MKLKEKINHRVFRLMNETRDIFHEENHIKNMQLAEKYSKSFMDLIRKEKRK